MRRSDGYGGKLLGPKEAVVVERFRGHKSSLLGRMNKAEQALQNHDRIGFYLEVVWLRTTLHQLEQMAQPEHGFWTEEIGE